MAEMDSLIAEIDRHARTQTRTRFCGRFTVTCVRRIQASRTMSESAKADRAKVPGEIRQEAMDGLKRSKQKKKAANKHLDNADEDLDGGGGDDTGLGKVPCVTPNKGTRTNRTWGTPDTGSGSQTGSDDVPCFEASLASFAQSKKESLTKLEASAAISGTRHRSRFRCPSGTHRTRTFCANASRVAERDGAPGREPCPSGKLGCSRRSWQEQPSCRVQSLRLSLRAPCLACK